ncbi:hypothetical protein [Desulfospira joergensenii]|uniref:hypothetical protein n=1 Tax=Desulfospira joergensenii TaxID=53329 RepID=UPI0003B7AEA1|nr:hypothetical protein [Desulfospira joergensenii]
MKAIQAEYDKASRKASIKKDARPEDWPAVCQKFNDDVERICDVGDMEGYTGLYACYDDANKAFFYLVREDKALYRMKRKHFLDNIGVDPAGSA